MTKYVVKENWFKCWDCDDFYTGKTKSWIQDRKTEHFKALTKSCQASAIADHITSTGHNIKWDHFETLATGRSDIHCRIKESLLIKDLKCLWNVKLRYWKIDEFERPLKVKKNGVFLFVISHLVPEIFKIFVLCKLGTDDVIRCENMEVKTQSREYLCK